MWNRMLCIGTNAQFGITREEQVILFKKIGFECFFTDEKETDIKKMKRLADELGMIYQSVHAPFSKVADMWKDGKESEIALDELIKCVNACGKNGVPIMICHAFIGFLDHSPNEHGLKNFGKLIDEAERAGVNIAFENTEGEEYLRSLMETFKDRKNVGFCWDSGHEQCYNHSRDMLELYGDKLIAMHLNDNLGIRDYDGKITFKDDLHLLPFDGIIDWRKVGERIKKTGYDGILTFELNKKSKPERCENDIYDKMDIESYLTEAYKRACKVAMCIG